MEQPQCVGRSPCSRRRILRAGIGGLAGLFTAGLARLAAAAPDHAAPPVRFARRDKYGGCPDIRFDPSGFFRLEKADRWWLVTPEGNAFLSFGINHVTPGVLREGVNREHWLKAFGAEQPADDRFWEGYRKKVRQDLDAFGFNTLGTHSPAKWYPRGFCPYLAEIRFVQISHWQSPAEKDFWDVFSPEFEAHCDALAKEHALPARDDPYLVGYSMSDCIILSDQDAAPRTNNVYGAERPALSTWPRVLRNLPADAPGKQAYVDCLREIYRDEIGALNRTYGTEFRAFADLAAARRWREQNDPRNERERRDNARFLERVVDRYYRTVVGAIRRYDGKHLIFGDKLNGNTDGADVALGIAKKYMDLVYYQTFGDYESQRAALDRWSRQTGQPLLNGDASFAVPTENMPDPYGPHFADQVERARAALEFAEASFSRPDFVGWHHCGWVDMWKTFAGKALKQHGGLQTPFGEYHRPILEAFSQFAARMYDVAAGVG